jgi:hypothetical protein
MKTKQELKEIFVTGEVITESILHELIDAFDSITEAQYVPKELQSIDGEAILSPVNGSLQFISLSEDTNFTEDGWDLAKFGNMTLIIDNLDIYNISMPIGFWDSEPVFTGSKALIEIFKLPNTTIKGVLAYAN